MVTNFTDSKGQPLGTPDRERLAPSITPPRLVWAPLRGHNGAKGSQELFMSCPCHHVLYHGTRGPGKTDAQVMQFRSKVGRGYGSFWRGIIFDRRYKNLDDLISKAKRWFLQFDDGVQFLKSQGDLKFVWPSGEELLFRKFSSDSDYWDYHGQEFTYIGWNELTKFATPKFYDLMMSCNRSSFVPVRHSPNLTDNDHALLASANYDLDVLGMTQGEAVANAIRVKLLPEIPLWVRSTTNPYGPGHGWVKRRFIDIAEPGVVHRVVTNVFNPRTQKREDITKTQVHIFGSYKENIYLAPEYVADLENITEENRRQAWLYGNWNITAGGAFDDLWKAEVHKIPRFKVPFTWRVSRAFDWGSTHPFSVGWWALCDGTEATMPDGRLWAPPRGTLIRISEWYGCAKDRHGQLRIGDNVGIKMSAGDIGKGIMYREKILTEEKWTPTYIEAGPADNQIEDKTQVDVDSIKLKLEGEGAYFIRSNKAPGSRKIGLQLMRDRLQASLLREGPGIYFMDNCRASLAIIPTLPRDEEDLDDIDTTAEDHIWDETRYVVLAGDTRYATKMNIQKPH